MVNRTLKLFMMSPWAFWSLVFKRGEAKYLAEHLSVVQQTITGWGREPNINGPNASGRRSPLQYMSMIIDYCLEYDETPDRAHQLAEYISTRAGGTFVPLPECSEEPDAELMQKLSEILKETAESISETNKAWFDEKTPGKFTRKEKERVTTEHLEAIRAHVQLIKLIERL